MSLPKNARMNGIIPAKVPAHLSPAHMLLFPAAPSFIYTIFYLSAFPAPSLLFFSVWYVCHPFFLQKNCYICWDESLSLSFSLTLFSISLPYLSLPCKPVISMWAEGPQKPPVQFNRTHLCTVYKRSGMAPFGVWVHLD